MLGASTVLVIDEGLLTGLLTRVTLFKVERELFDAIERNGGVVPDMTDASSSPGCDSPEQHMSRLSAAFSPPRADQLAPPPSWLARYSTAF